MNDALIVTVYVILDDVLSEWGIAPITVHKRALAKSDGRRDRRLPVDSG